MHRLPVLAVLVVTLLGGCMFESLKPSEKLREAVLDTNDQSRWGRFDLARSQVSPEYAQKWAQSHYRWGREIEIADHEVLDVRMATDQESATSTVSYSWYSYDTMTLRRSVLKQKWEGAAYGGGYYLAAEEVVDGDPTLLDIPEELLADDPDEDETSGGESPREGEAEEPGDATLARR